MNQSYAHYIFLALALAVVIVMFGLVSVPAKVSGRDVSVGYFKGRNISKEPVSIISLPKSVAGTVTVVAVLHSEVYIPSETHVEVVDADARVLLSVPLVAVESISSVGTHDVPVFAEVDSRQLANGSYVFRVVSEPIIRLANGVRNSRIVTVAN